MSVFPVQKVSSAEKIRRDKITGKNMLEVSIDYLIKMLNGLKMPKKYLG